MAGPGPGGAPDRVRPLRPAGGAAAAAAGAVGIGVGAGPAGRRRVPVGIHGGGAWRPQPCEIGSGAALRSAVARFFLAAGSRWCGRAPPWIRFMEAGGRGGGLLQCLSAARGPCVAGVTASPCGPVGTSNRQRAAGGRRMRRGRVRRRRHRRSRGATASARPPEWGGGLSLEGGGAGRGTVPPGAAVSRSGRLHLDV